MRFAEFLPQLSLAFILWTLFGAAFAIGIWVVMFAFYKAIPKTLLPVRLEHTTALFIFIGLLILMQLVKRYHFPYVYLTDFITISIAKILLIVGILAAVVSWLGSKYAERILTWLDDRISPLVWLFAFLFTSAVLITVFNIGFTEASPVQANRPHVAGQEKVRPNIIFVLMDALTALDMQVYGYNRETTPFISEWAKDAVVFNRAYSASNWTTPGTMSILTGQRPWTHRVWHSVRNKPVGRYEYNMPGILRDNGYDVYGFVSNPAGSLEGLGMKDDFINNYDYNVFRLPMEIESSWFFRCAKVFEHKRIVQKWIFEDNFIARGIISSYKEENIVTTLTPPELVFNRFLEFMSQRKSGRPESSQAPQEKEQQRPFFAWLHVFPPHDPYLPAKPYMGKFGDVEKYNSWQTQFHRFGLEYGSGMQKEIDILRKRYDEFILYTDQQFKTFMSDLAETVDMNNTIIVLVSDHGESFSHGWWSHTGPHLYESLVHVPLIIKMPGTPNGNIINIPVGHIDLAPTVLELAGIAVPGWMEGRSLKPFIDGRGSNAYPVFSMSLENDSYFKPITKATIAVREGDYKLIYYLKDKKTLLFNTETDPDELLNLTQEQPEITLKLKKLIEKNLSQANEKFTQSHR